MFPPEISASSARRSQSISAKAIDGVAAHAATTFDFDPLSAAIYIFRSHRADRLKLLIWDGSGLVLFTKRLNGKRVVQPKAREGPLVLSKVQLDALFEEID